MLVEEEWDDPGAFVALLWAQYKASPGTAVVGWKLVQRFYWSNPYILLAPLQLGMLVALGGEIYFLSVCLQESV